MQVKKIIVCDALHQSGLELLESCGDVEFIDASAEPKDKLLEMIGDYDVAITRSSTDVDDKFLSKATNLSSIVRAGV